MTQDLSHEQAVTEQILVKAEELFRHYGYAKTGVADIAQACGMSPANLYRFFKGKQAIAEAILRQFFAQKRAEMVAAVAATPGPAAAQLHGLLQNAVMRMIAETRRSPRIVEMAEICCPVHGEDATDGGALADHLSAQAMAMADLIGRGMADGSLRSVNPMQDATLLCQTLASVMDPKLIIHFGLEDAEARADLLIEFALRGLSKAST